MSNPDQELMQPRGHRMPAPIANTVALTGVALTLVAVALYGWLFYTVRRMPADPAEFQRLSGQTPAQIRLIILACSAGVLNLVGFALGLVGLFLPGRPRLLAAVGTVAAFVLLAGVFGVLAVGVLLQHSVNQAASP